MDEKQMEIWRKYACAALIGELAKSMKIYKSDEIIPIYVAGLADEMMKQDEKRRFDKSLKSMPVQVRAGTSEEK